MIGMIEVSERDRSPAMNQLADFGLSKLLLQQDTDTLFVTVREVCYRACAVNVKQSLNK